MTKRCLIISALIEGYGDWIADEAKNAYVIAADGGYAYAKEMGINVDLMIGDFDSYDGEMPDEDQVEIIRVSAEKDDTDTSLCIKEAIERGYKDIMMIGGIGGRLSHTIANLQSMAGFASKVKKIRILDGNRRIFVMHGPTQTEVTVDDYAYNTVQNPEKKHYISLFAHDGDCSGVNVQGVYYPLSDKTLTNTFPLGVSNELTAEKAVISVKKGTLIVIVE